MKVTTPQNVNASIDKASKIASELPAKATWSFPSPVDRVRDALMPATDYIRDQLNREVPMDPHEPAANIVQRVREAVLEASGFRQDEIGRSGEVSKL